MGVIKSGNRTVVDERPTTTPKFSRGQVVRIDTEYYRRKSDRLAEQFQKITSVWSWSPTKSGTPKWGYTFANGDKCSEKFVKPLTAKEIG